MPGICGAFVFSVEQTYPFLKIDAVGGLISVESTSNTDQGSFPMKIKVGLYNYPTVSLATAEIKVTITAPIRNNKLPYFDPKLP